jgi:hypothetical protein
VCTRGRKTSRGEQLLGVGGVRHVQWRSDWQCAARTRRLASKDSDSVGAVTFDDLPGECHHADIICVHHLTHILQQQQVRRVRG